MTIKIFLGTLVILLAVICTHILLEPYEEKTTLDRIVKKLTVPSVIFGWCIVIAFEYVLITN